MENWSAHVEREARRYEDGVARLPSDPDGRQKQLVRVANAASGAGLACLMDGRPADAAAWLRLAAERYRESYTDAPAGSWGRLLGALKARLLAGDLEGAQADAEWSLAQSPGDSESPIGRYAAVLAALVLARDDEAAALTNSLVAEPDDRFPLGVANALAGLAARDRHRYETGLRQTLRSFETRDAYLEEIPVADTVLALETLAAPRGLAVRPRSALLP